MLVFLPCLIFSVLVDASVALSQYGQLALAACAIIIGSGILAYPLCRLLGYSVKTFVPPLMFNNSGNLGMPLMLFAFGEAALAPAVILFLVENTLHFSIGMKILSPRYSLWQIGKIPMVAATVAGILVNLSHVSLPQVLLIPIEMMGQIAIPLMLVALGIRLGCGQVTQLPIGISAAILCPLTGIGALCVLTPWLDLPLLQWQLLVVYSVLPPAVLNYMVAEQFQQEPSKVASIVLIGNLFSFVSLPLVLIYVFS